MVIRIRLVDSRPIAPINESPPSTLLERLSDRYDLCCYGLREVRRQWESGGGGGSGSSSILLD